MLNISNNERLEFIGQMIDIFEDFLEEKGINIDNPEREDSENPAIIYGTDYDSLSERLETMLTAWGILEKE